MPSLLHEILVRLFVHRPAFAADLLRDLLHIDLPPVHRAEIRSADLPEVVPTEYRADGVILFNGDDPPNRFSVINEIQLRPAPRKRFTWPEYLVSHRARLECSTYLLVICPDDAVARWAAEPIPMGHPGYVLTPLVIGPEMIPVITDPAEVRRLPELAVLSAMTYGPTPQGFEVARAIFEGTAALDEEQGRLYRDLARYWLNEMARKALEALMSMRSPEWESEMFADLVADGKKKGLAEGRAEDVILFLEARGLPPSDEHRKRIRACRDLDQLTHWVRRAAVVRTADELFDAPEPS